MCRIILIATVHKKLGKCNSNELLKIIEEIEPEIIFEEVPPRKFKLIYEDETFTDSLETATIKRYLRNHSISHFPVDLDLDELFEKKMRSEVMKMFNTFDQYEEIQLLRMRHDELVHKHGFPYLNNEKCTLLFDRIHWLEEDILRLFDDELFSKAYENWLDNLKRREEEMIKQIYSFSIKFNFKRALFLVGAEHRNSMMKKVSNLEKGKKNKIVWDFNFF